MERLQWWLLLLSAVMFSMSGCATLTDWNTWAEHPAHYASEDHMAFSVKSHPTTASISEADTEAAAREEWWGRLVPEDVIAAEGMDVTGRWRGMWSARGPFGDVRVSEAEATFAQSGTAGTGHVRLRDTVAASGVPEILRLAGSWGVPVRYDVATGQVVARYDDGRAMEMRFTRVGDRLYGRVAAYPSLLLVLEKDAAAAPIAAAPVAAPSLPAASVAPTRVAVTPAPEAASTVAVPEVAAPVAAPEPVLPVAGPETAAPVAAGPYASGPVEVGQ